MALNLVMLIIFDEENISNRGLRSLGVKFPPHDSSDEEVVEFLRTKKFREQVLWEGL
jgi:hypothetical protein